MKTILRSIGCVLAGIATVSMLSICTDVLLRKAGVFPAILLPMSTGLYLLASLYRTVFGIAGGWVAAKLAPGRPIKHALVYGGIGTALALLGTIITWKQGPEFGPKWYPLFLTLTALPSAWIGAKLAFRTQNQPSA